MNISSQRLFKINRVGSLLLDEVKQLRKGKICAVFSRSFAIQCEKLIFTVSQQVGGLPLGIEINGKIDFLSKSLIGKSIIFNDNGFSCTSPDWLFDWGSADVWDGKKSIDSITLSITSLYNRIEEMVEFIKEHELRMGSSKSMNSLHNQPHSNSIWESGEITNCIVDISEYLQRRCIDFSEEKLDSAITGLMGLGPGLTPSGDDFLTGLILCLKVTSSLGPDLAKKSHNIINCVEKNRFNCTNLFGGSYLYTASRGHGSGPLINVLRAIWEGKGNIESSLLKLTAIGSSSGVDTLLGISVGLNVALTYIDN